MKPILRQSLMMMPIIALLAGMADARRKPVIIIKKPVASVAQPPVSSLPNAPDSTVREQRLLAAHNRERESMGLPTLTWSDRLASDARLWAQHLAQTATFDHAPPRPGKDDQGENLWMGTAGAYSPEDMVGDWIGEKALFKRGRFPDVSITRNWIDVGHYTQIIWRNTRTVGCAVATNRGDDYLVCRYGPPGNWMGEDPLGTSKSVPVAKIPTH
ncbi:MAG: hypothetical protein RL367_1782 [Pseudomonadota bacterium]